jgi:hypothetical protein
MTVIRMGMGRMVVTMIERRIAMMMVVVMTLVMVMVVVVAIVTVVEMVVPRMMVMSVRVITIGADPLDVMVVALLNEPDLCLKSQHMRAVLAQRAVHLVLALGDFLHPVGEGIKDQGMILQILRLQELDLRMALGHLIGNPVDALHQHAGKEKVGEDDDSPVAQLDRMLKARPH